MSVPTPTELEHGLIWRAMLAPVVAACSPRRILGLGVDPLLLQILVSSGDGTRGTTRLDLLEGVDFVVLAPGPTVDLVAVLDLLAQRGAGAPVAVVLDAVAQRRVLAAHLAGLGNTVRTARLLSIDCLLIVPRRRLRQRPALRDVLQDARSSRTLSRQVVLQAAERRRFAAAIDGERVVRGRLEVAVRALRAEVLAAEAEAMRRVRGAHTTSGD